jgi:hypothetical protein
VRRPAEVRSSRKPTIPDFIWRAQSIIEPDSIDDLWP